VFVDHFLSILCMFTNARLKNQNDMASNNTPKGLSIFQPPIKLMSSAVIGGD